MDIEIITSMQELENHPIKYHAADEVRRKLLELYYIAGNHYDYCHADYPVSGEPGDSAHLEKAVRFHEFTARTPATSVVGGAPSTYLSA